MKTVFVSLLFFTVICSCRQEPSLIDAEITKVTPQFKPNHYDLPHVRFSILIKNQGNRPTTLYVTTYGRNPPKDSGSWWVYYNNKVDSLQLFSASCENCYEKTVLKPEDSLNLILQINYSSMAKNTEADSIIDEEINEVFQNWNAVKYFDNMNTLIIEARR